MLRSALSMSSTAAALGDASGSGGASEKVFERFSLCDARTRSLEVIISQEDIRYRTGVRTFVAAEVDDKFRRAPPFGVVQRDEEQEEI